MSRIKKAGNVWNAERLMNRKERQGIVTEEDGWYLKRHYCRNGGIKGSRVGYGEEKRREKEGRNRRGNVRSGRSGQRRYYGVKGSGVGRGRDAEKTAGWCGRWLRRGSWTEQGAEKTAAERGGVSAGGRKVRKTVLSALRKAVSGMGEKAPGERRPQPARQWEKRSESGQRRFFIVNFSF